MNQSNDKKKEEKNNRIGSTIVGLWTAILIIVGFVLIIFVLILEPKMSSWSNLIGTLGAGLLVGCIFSVIIQRKELRDYIGEEVSEVIQEDTYLDKLSDERLADLRLKIDKKRIGAIHIEKGESLYKFITENLQDPFVNEPHRVGVVKTILAQEWLNNKEYLNVTETTTYRIRHSAYPRTGLPVDYKLKSHSEIRTKYENKDKLDYRLSIKIDDDIEIIGEEKPKEKDYKEILEEIEKIEGYYTSKVDDNYTLLFFQKILSLEKEYTHITIREDSLMEKKDRSYCYTSTYPTYGVSINFILPRGFIIDKPLLGNSWYLKTEKPSIVNSIEGVNTNNVSITMDSWILPGIIAGVTWEYSS